MGRPIIFIFLEAFSYDILLAHAICFFKKVIFEFNIDWVSLGLAKVATSKDLGPSQSRKPFWIQQLKDWGDGYVGPKARQKSNFDKDPWPSNESYPLSFFYFLFLFLNRIIIFLLIITGWANMNFYTKKREKKWKRKTLILPLKLN